MAPCPSREAQPELLDVHKDWSPQLAGAGGEARRETSRRIRYSFPAAVASGKHKPCQAAACVAALRSRQPEGRQEPPGMEGIPCLPGYAYEAGFWEGQPQTFSRGVSHPIFSPD